MSAGQQMFNLRWNNFQSSISSALHEQLLGEELVDVTLSAEGRTVGAHRVVLSACSPYFKHLFKANIAGAATPGGGDSRLKFSDIQTLLAFIYQGEVQVSNSALPSLLKTAEALSIKGLTPSHLREEQPPFADALGSWADTFAPPPAPVRARPPAADESPAKRAKACPEAPRASAAADTATPAPLNLSASCSPPLQQPPQPQPPPPQQQQQPPQLTQPPAAARFTLKIPSVGGLAAAAEDSGTGAASPRQESDDDAVGAEGSPIWKNLLPKPNRRMLPVKCPECSKLISNAYNLRVHMDLHKHLTYLCSICSTPTRSRDTLRKHITNIHKVKGEALREMLDHGIVSSAASSGGEEVSVKEEPAEDELVVDERAATPPPPPPVAEPPPPPAAVTHC